MRFASVLVLAGLLVSCASSPQPRASGCALAQRYVEAANSGDPGTVAPLLAENAYAIFLAERPGGHSITSGKASVLDAVDTYTSHCTSCRSTAVCLHESDSAVYLIERVEFIDQNGVARTQSAPLIIETRNGRIAAIVYFPEYRRAAH